MGLKTGRGLTVPGDMGGTASRSWSPNLCQGSSSLSASSLRFRAFLGWVLPSAAPGPAHSHKGVGTHIFYSF